jgi:hypothetical protein
VLPVGFEIVNVSAVDAPSSIVDAANAATTSGGATTANAPAGSLHAVEAAACRLSPP